MDSITIHKGDTKILKLNFKNNWDQVESQLNIVGIVKKDWQDDEDAIGIFFAKDGELKIHDLEERGEYLLVIKGMDDKDRYTIKEIPLIIK